MSDDGKCHLPNCDEPRATATLCRYHAERLLAPVPIKRPRPVERREAA